MLLSNSLNFKNKRNKQKIHVALLVDEFFSNDLPFSNGKGGYGMLAKNYICKYLNDQDIEVDAIIGFNKEPVFLEYFQEKQKIIYLPTYKIENLRLKRWISSFLHWVKLKRYISKYDIFITIEFQSIAQHISAIKGFNKKIIFWLQDPRPQSDWDELDTMKDAPQGGYRPNPKVSNLVKQLYRKKRLFFISQGEFLIPKARALYDLPSLMTASLLLNPIDLPNKKTEELISQKENSVIFLGRLDSVKRPWIIGEIAKRMPDITFFFMGQYHEEKMKTLMVPYTKLPNCIFLGHLEGEAKGELIAKCKILINTSIHEAIPVSFLEALSYGTLLVSNRNPDSITSKFGIAIDQENGMGINESYINKFISAIQHICENQEWQQRKALDAIQYIRETHASPIIISKLKDYIFKNL